MAYMELYTGTGLYWYCIGNVSVAMCVSSTGWNRRT
jgi:hypothetical protein